LFSNLCRSQWFRCGNSSFKNCSFSLLFISCLLESLDLLLFHFSSSFSCRKLLLIIHKAWRWLDTLKSSRLHMIILCHQLRSKSTLLTLFFIFVVFFGFVCFIYLSFSLGVKLIVLFFGPCERCIFSLGNSFKIDRANACSCDIIVWLIYTWNYPLICLWNKCAFFFQFFMNCSLRLKILFISKMVALSSQKFCFVLSIVFIQA